MINAGFEGPIALFLGDVESSDYLKSAIGLLHWRREDCLAQVRLSRLTPDLGLPDTDASTLPGKVKSLIIGSAPRGGALPQHWIGELAKAAESGVDIVAGLHDRLADAPALVRAAENGGSRLWDLRVPPPSIPVATGRKRSGKRVLTVGTDCVAGKKYTAMALAKALAKRGVPSDFRATGQTGIMIAGSGIPIDAVVSDFVAGAAEQLSPDNVPDHWDVIEGQGSLFHPSYAGVALGLLHGSQPDALIMCHPGHRTHIVGLPDFRLPDIRAAIERNLEAARLTNPDVRFVGVSVNTSKIGEHEREALLERLAKETGLPCLDPVRDGVVAFVEALLECG